MFYMGARGAPSEAELRKRAISAIQNVALKKDKAILRP